MSGREHGHERTPHEQEPAGRQLGASAARLPEALAAAGNVAIADLLAGARSEPVEGDLRAGAERRLGTPLGDVRVHRGGRAHDAARTLGAVGFTRGSDIVLSDSAPGPETAAGRNLLQHELTHVVQQRSADGLRLTVDTPGDAWEQAAEAGARGEPVPSPAGPAPAIQRQTPPPHLARGFGGEQTMGFVHYRMEDGWAVVRGPSGSAGHAANAAGEDGLVYNVRNGLLRIADNKSLARAGNAGSATAIAENLEQNVGEMTDAVEAMSPEELPMRQDVLRLLRQTRAALRAGTPIPGRVSLVVHGEGGRSTGVTARLQAMGIKFVATPAQTAPIDPAGPRPALVGGPRPTVTPEGQYEFPGMATKPGKTTAGTGAAAAETAEAVGTTGSAAQLELALGGAGKEVAAVEGASTAGRLAGGTLLGRGLRFGGSLLVSALIGLLIGWGLAKLQEGTIRRAFDALEGRLSTALAALEARVAGLQATAYPATVWLHVAIRTTRSVSVSAMGGAYNDIFTGVELVSVDTSTDYLSSRKTTEGPHIDQVYVGSGFAADFSSHTETDDVVCSFPVAYGVEGRSAAERAARIAEIERDGSRPDLPVAGLEALFAEREALIAGGRP